MMLKIIAQGGGDMRKQETTSMDQEIVDFCGKENPKVLFLGTARGDSESYISQIENYFGKLGCNVDALKLNKETREEELEKIFKTDIIYVGGGNTLMMMNKRRKYGIDKLLKQAAEQGIVLSGLSAGAMCWCFSGRSDSRATKGGNGYINVRRLSLLNFYCCVHYKEENYEDIKERLRKNNKVGIILEDCCALQVYGENYRIIASREGSKAYKAYRTHGKYVFEELLQKEEYSSLKNLYNT